VLVRILLPFLKTDERTDSFVMDLIVMMLQNTAEWSVSSALSRFACRMTEVSG